MVWKPGVRGFRFFSDNLLMDKTIVQAVILACPPRLGVRTVAQKKNGMVAFST